jgi:hypothetical protein
VKQSAMLLAMEDTRDGMAWAIVFATLFGPIFAVLISLWRERRTALYNRRLQVFRTLMATRKVGVSAEHVTALNMVEVDFYKCATVESAWQHYKTHLDVHTDTPAADAAWMEERETRLAKLLCAIGAVLDFKIPAIEIFKGGYAPKGWMIREGRQMAALEYLNALSSGTKAVPVEITSPPAPKKASEPTSHVHPLLGGGGDPPR